MRYESAKTAKGNIGVSYLSQEEADAQAAQMDANNCRDCSNCSNCRDCSYCSYCSNCQDCSYCSYCSNCWGCSNCSGVLIWRGGDTSHLLAINGLHGPVAISQDKMQIGCQNHTHQEWDGFDDETIARMGHHALDFWRGHKAMLMAMCAMKAKGE